MKIILQTDDAWSSFILRVMLGVVIFPHGAQKLLGWFGKQPGEGFEYHLLVLAMSVALLITGSGKWSVDRAIAKKLTG